MRSLGVVGSTIHSMMKFPTNQGVVMIETSREALWECKQLEKVQGQWKEVQWRQREEKMSRIREHTILRTKSSFGHRPNQGIERKGVRLAEGRDDQKVQHPELVADTIPIKIKKLSDDTSKDDGKGLDQSKRAKRGSIPGINSGEKQKQT
ncbi:hypothetical protein Tco_1402140 [Tanacetum coccineum]